MRKNEPDPSGDMLSVVQALQGAFNLFAIVIAILLSSTLTIGNRLYAQSPPSVSPLSPPSGTGFGTTFVTTITDPNGATTLSDILFFVSTGWNQPFCLVKYNGQSDLLYLADDPGSNVARRIHHHWPRFDRK